ncbi:MAG: zinc-binding dehydrogenase [Candidatus Hermodarchaeota archaeon]
MKRILIKDPNMINLEEIPDPSPGFGEIKLQIAYCGICGSDLHAYQGKHPFISLPATPGHEFSARIVELGEGVNERGMSFEIGQRVTCEPSLVCGQCYLCKTGRYNICENLRVMGCQAEGAMSEYIIVPAEKVVPIPEELSLKHAVLVEPLAVAVHAIRNSKINIGDNVVILGAGTIGLFLLQMAKLAGAKNIIVTDIQENRLALAKDLGATRVINAAEEDPMRILLKEKPFEGWEIVFEAVGIETTMQQALDIVRKGGKVIVVGVFGAETTVIMKNVQDREIEIIGTLMYVMRDIKDAIDLIASRKVKVEFLITSVYKLEQAEEAFKTAFDTQNQLKVIFEISP